MLTVCTWLWGDKYGSSDVAKLVSGVRRNMMQDYRFVVFTDRKRLNIDGVDELPIPQQDLHMTKEKGCFVRLRVFDLVWQRMVNLYDRIFCVDLDAIVTGNLDQIVNRPETFIILGGANAANPCPFNGSVFMLRAGYHKEVWLKFDFKTEMSWKRGATSPIRPTYYEFPDDQGWIAHVLPNAATWAAGSRSGIYAFQKPGWPKGDALPDDARLVVFPGWRSPEKFKHLPWVNDHWK